MSKEVCIAALEIAIEKLRNEISALQTTNPLINDRINSLNNKLTEFQYYFEQYCYSSTI